MTDLLRYALGGDSADGVKDSDSLLRNTPFS